MPTKKESLDQRICFRVEDNINELLKQISRLSGEKESSSAENEFNFVMSYG